MTTFSALPEWIDRLGWVLLHFLWQGTLIGVMAWTACQVLHAASARVRYAVLGLALAACGLAPVVTWTMLAPASEAFVRVATTGSQGGTVPIESAPPSSGPMTSAVIAASAAAPDSFQATVERSLPCLVACWGIGVVILTLRLIYAWLDLRRMRAAGRPVDDRVWTARLAALARRMGVTRAIAFLECAQVDVPTVAGWFRPVLLVPVQFLTSLPSPQVEAILAHELAHICRHDYLFNLVQIFIETLLFYHPAIWWLGSALRKERENCCDDIAVRVTGDELTYATALAALEQSRSSPFAVTLAATGGTLLDRVRRVLGQPPTRHSRQAWFAPLVLAALVVSALGASLYSLAETAPDETQDPFGTMDLSQGSIDTVERLKNAFRNAVIADQVGLAEAFLRHGLKLAPTDIKSGVGDILGDAIYFTNDPKMIRMLLAHGAKPAGDMHERNATVNDGLRSGDKEITDLLIAAGATCDPIWYDAALGQLDDLKKRDAQAPLDVKNIRHARDYALDAGQIETFDWLWAKSQTADTAKAKILADSYNRAAQNGRLRLLLHLEKMGAKTADGGTEALLNAVGGNHLEVARHLFARGAKLQNDPRWFRGLLGEAAGDGHLKMVALLLDHGANIDAKDGDDETALGWAASNGHDDVCQYLVEHGANLDIADKFGHTAVWDAAEGPHCPIALELMLEKGARFPWVDTRGRGLFEAAMQFVPPQLGRQGFPGDVLTPAGQRAYDAREEKVVDLLISAGLDPTGKAGTDTPLKVALVANHYPAARALLRHHPDVNVKDAQGNPPITYLFNNCHTTFPLDVLESVLAQGADPNGSYPIPGLTPPINFTVLQTALGSFRDTTDEVANQRAAVAMLIDHGARFPGVKSEADEALLLASVKGDLNEIKATLAKGGSANAQDSFGYSPLLISMNLRYFDNVLWLLNHGADPTKSLTMWGESLLPVAVEANRTDMVELLLAKGVDPRGGVSGLDAAVLNGNRKIFDDLLKAGANPKNASILTCIQYGQPEMAQILLDRGADPQPPPIMENRANVYWAVCYNQPQILQGLLDHGADPTMVDAYRETPLSVAKEFHMDMVPMLEAAIQRWQAKAH